MLTRAERDLLISKIPLMCDAEIELTWQLLQEWDKLGDYRRFLETTSNGNWKTNPHLEYIIRKIEDVIEGKNKRLIINVAPRMGKSELTSKNLPAYLLLRNPELEIVTASYSGDLSTEFNKIAMQLYQRLHEDYGKAPLDRSTAANWSIKGHKGSSIAVVNN